AITPPSARRVTSLTVAARASVVKREYGERGRNEPPRRRVPRRLDHRGFPVLGLPPPHRQPDGAVAALGGAPPSRPRVAQFRGVGERTDEIAGRFDDSV